MNQLWAVVVALLPSIGVGFLFYKIIKAIVEGDRNERRAQAKWEAEEERSRRQEARTGVAAEPVDMRGHERGPELERRDDTTQ